MSFRLSAPIPSEVQTLYIVEITHDKRGVMQGFTTNSDISNTKAKPECF